MQSGKIDLAQVKGAFRYTIKGATTSKECLCIPLEMLYQGQNNSAWLNLSVFDAGGKWGKQFSIKQSLPADMYRNLSDEEKRSIPFIGEISLPKGAAQAAAPRPSVSSNPDDLPF